MDTIKLEERGSAKIIAHRGLSGIEKENTNAAFIAAGNRSYFGIETDVHRTVDGKFVCIHDDRTGRVAVDDLEIEKSTFDTLRRLNLCDENGVKGREDLHIPTLKEYISTCKRYNKTAVLELKNQFEKEDVRKIIDEIIEVDYLSNVIFISFAFDNLVYVRDFYPEHTVQYLIEDRYPEDLDEKLISHKFDLDIDYHLIDAEKIKKLHEAGIKINCWTVNDKAAAEQLCRDGIDFITTNILE